MAAESQQGYFTVNEYLALEETSEEKHEYIDGLIYLIAGDTPGHSALAVNVVIALGLALRGGPCRVFNSDAKVQLAEERYVYPDATVSCDERDVRWDGSVRLPVVIVEVLSPSTEAYDRGRKLRLYRDCPTVQEYVLVNTDQQLVEVFRKGTAGAWTLYPYGPDSEVDLHSVGIRFPITDVYSGVPLQTQDPS